MDTDKITDKIVKAFKNGNKLMICGNGGSAAQAQHMAAELIGRFEHERIPLPAIALTTDTSILSALANDYGYEYVFSRQIEALGKKGDILLILSTSGKSKNCLKAKETAEKMKIEVIDLMRDGDTTSERQELHLVYIHEICRKVEEAFI